MWWSAAHGERFGDAVTADGALGGVGLAGGGFGGEGGVLESVGFGFCGGIDYDLGVDDHAAMFGGFGGHASGGECWAKNGD